MKPTTRRTVPEITRDGTGVVSNAGTVPLAELADPIGLTALLSEATDGLRERHAGHDPGRVLIDVAVAIADGAVTISDIHALADHEGLHGPAGTVASTPTIWRVLAGIDAAMLVRIRQGRAEARDRAWTARGDLTGRELPGSRAAGKTISSVVIDLDATLVTAHSEKEDARGNFKGGFGHHPLGAWLDNTNEALAMLLRPGNTGSNTASDHLTVLEQALSQIPDRWRSKKVLIRAEGAGYSHARITALSEQGLGFSVGYPVTEAVRDAIKLIPKWAWTPANNADGGLREDADVVEVTDMLDLSRWTVTCSGMRVIVRREHPHPGATLDAFEIRDGYRFQAFTTKTRGGQLPFLDARHRAHARVEDRIRTGKDTGIWHLPSRHAHINEVWIELARLAADLLALAQSMLLTDQSELHRAEPKTLRYRLLHTAARITKGQRKVYLRLGRAPALGPCPGQSIHPPTDDPAPGLTASTTAPSHPDAHGDTGPRAGTPSFPPSKSKIPTINNGRSRPY